MRGEADIRPDDWQAVFECAAFERCAALAWLRIAEPVKAAMPLDVRRQWRNSALGVTVRASRDYTELVALLDSLELHDVRAIVMKGQPLSKLLYGDPFVRPSFDIDLFVPPAERANAHQVLLADGWRHSEGDAPREGTYLRPGAVDALSLELHSRLLDDCLLSHLPSPTPASRSVSIGGRQVRAHGGHDLPIYLAVHLAKHGSASLLWWIDFATLWSSYTDEERTDIRARAKELRLSSFLRWAEIGTSLVATAAHDADDSQAFAAAGKLMSLHRRHNALRVSLLAPGITGRLGVAMGWAWPAGYREDPRRYARASAERAWRFLERTLGGRPGSQRPASGGVTENERHRILAVDHPTFQDLVREVIAGGAAVWVRARGNSMLPAIPSDAAVLVAPLSPAGPAVGDVVLAIRGHGRPVLHRVINVTDGDVRLRGDNTLKTDPPISRSMLLGVATKVRVGTATLPIAHRRRSRVRMALRRLRARFSN
jgi:hypothetical protein